MGDVQGNSVELIDRWRKGDQAAAKVLFDRYVDQLVALVRAHLTEKLARRFDAEDVVQSAYRSFFVGTRKGRYLIEQSGDLWRLLVAISLHKMHHQVEKHSAAKRSIVKEAYFVDNESLRDQFANEIVQLPSASDALETSQDIEAVFNRLDDVQKQMFELRLEGYTLEEIAEQTRRSVRTVRRSLEKIKHLLIDKYPEFFTSDDSSEPTVE